jgi:sugar-specific transcriptional regulator TrmB
VDAASSDADGDGMEKIESLLKDIGMKEYEAKAFNVVVQSGVCSADQINKMSRIPLTRVYETMQNLQKLGLVTVLNTRPKKYRLVSVDALANLLEQKRNRMTREIERSKAIIKEIKAMIPKNTNGKSEEIKEGFWMFTGREASIRKITEDSRKAAKELLFFSDDFSWMPRFRKVIEERISNGTQVKVLVNVNEKTMGTIRELIEMGADVRGWDVQGLRGGITDSTTVHLVSKIPRTGTDPKMHYGIEGSDELFMYNCLSTANPIIVNMVKTYFDVFWWRGEKPRV